MSTQNERHSHQTHPAHNTFGYRMEMFCSAIRSVGVFFIGSLWLRPHNSSDLSVTHNLCLGIYFIFPHIMYTFYTFHLTWNVASSPSGIMLANYTSKNRANHCGQLDFCSQHSLNIIRKGQMLQTISRELLGCTQNMRVIKLH